MAVAVLKRLFARGGMRAWLRCSLLLYNLVTPSAAEGHPTTFLLEPVVRTSLGEAVQNLVTYLATLIELVDRANLELGTSLPTIGSVDHRNTPSIQVAVEIPNIGDGEWDRNHPGRASIPMSSLLDLTDSPSIAFVPKLPAERDKKNCTLGLAVQLTAQKWSEFNQVKD